MQNVVAQLINEICSLVERLDELEKIVFKVKLLETNNGK